MRHLDLFSGIGGFALAAQWVWGDEHEIISFCDNDKAAQVVLSKHWPGVPIHDDIKTLDATKWRGTIDLVTGGFPCQPFSCAGKRRGAADDRAIWPEMLRVIDECQPRWVLGENVPGIIGMELDRVLADLERAGYEARTLIVPACAVDAPHIRARVWIVARREGERGRRISRAMAAENRFVYEQETQIRSEAHTIEYSRQDVADAPREGLERAIAEGSIRAERLSTECGDVPNAASAECERCRRARERGPGFADGGEVVPDATGKQNGRLQQRSIQANACDDCDRGGEAATWPTEPALGRVAHGVPYRVDRLRLLGNAIVPQVAAEIFKAMKAVDE